MSAEIIVTRPTALTTHDSLLHDRIEALLFSLSDTSKRQYAYTFSLWLDFCQQSGVQPLSLTDENVLRFLGSGDLSKSTKQARLTHLRRLAQTLYAGDTTNAHFRNCYEQLKLLKIRGQSGGRERTRKALSRKQVYDVLDHWSDKNSALHARNRALLEVLFYCGLRRSEAVALKWVDIDLEAGLMTVRHGKGDKERIVPIPNEAVIATLEHWRSFIPDFAYVFPAIRKGDHIQADEPMSVEALYKVVRASGDFAPHDARRTVLTDMIASGTPVSDAQQFAGHAQAATTLRYAQKSNAKAVRSRIKMSY